MGKKSKHNKGGASSPSHANGSATSSPAVTAGKKKAGGSPAKQPAAVDTAPHSIKETSGACAWHGQQGSKQSDACL